MIEYKVKVNAYGSKYWCKNDKLHREDGPAIECADGSEYWYLNGEELTKQEHKRTMTKPTYSGKEVTIDGVTYVLKEKNNV